MRQPGPAKPDALLLDAGNTLVFVDRDVMARVLAGHGTPVTALALAQTQRDANRAYANELQRGAGHDDGWYVFMRHWLVLAGVREERANDACRALRSVHDDFNLWRQVPPDLVPALERARAAGIVLGVVSNSEGQLERLFRRVGLEGLFDVVVDSGLEGVSKPNPEIFLRACRRLELPPARCLYAGDIPDVDIVGATNAGMRAALVDPLDMYGDETRAERFVSVATLIDAILVS